ncbi:MAG: nucleoside hydrolase [Patescibacteria group bacterium]|jgi:inosine-uridine nucleoside N-ribohydrolase
MNQIIIDTDPGVDDALAIALACLSKLNVVALTTVYGNVNIADSTRNALTILSVINKKVSVYQGASKPLINNAIKAQSHGEKGLGGFATKLNWQKSRRSARKYLEDTFGSAADTSITLVCIGPATNIAKLFIANPQSVTKIKDLVILGGVFNEKGNMSQYSEFNAINDPEALKIVLNANCNKVLIPINICRKVVFKKSDFNKLINKKLQRSFGAIADAYINYYTSGSKYGQFTGGVMYDLLTVVYLLEPKLFKTIDANVNVITRLGPMYGRTIIKKIGKVNCRVVSEIKPRKVKQVFFNVLNK